MLNIDTDLFTVNYKSVVSAPNADQLDFTVVVYPNSNTINGAGEMMLQTGSHTEIETQIKGSFITTLVAGSKCFLITAMGFQKGDVLNCQEERRNQEPNLLIELAIGEDWQSGVANIKYKRMAESGCSEWIRVSDIRFQATTINKLNWGKKTHAPRPQRKRRIPTRGDTDHKVTG